MRHLHFEFQIRYGIGIPRVNHMWHISVIDIFWLFPIMANFSVVLFRLGTELELGKKVSDYHVPNMAGIAICIRQKGGPGLTPLTGYISLTSDPCCMTYDDDPGERRAKMTCGCAISEWVHLIYSIEVSRW